MSKHLLIKLIGIFGVITILLSGCASGSVSESVQTETDTELTEESIKIKWLADSFIPVPEAYLEEANRVLKDKGYNYEIEFVYYDVEEHYGKTDYYYLEDISAAIQENKPDIISGTGDLSTLELAEAGLLECLDGYFETGSGKRLYEFYPENYWLAGKYKGNTYYCPTTYYCCPSNLAVEFNPDWVSREEYEAFDGSMESLKAMCEEKEDSCIIILLPEYDIAECMGYTMFEGSYIDKETLRCVKPERLREFYEPMNELRSEGKLVTYRDYCPWEMTILEYYGEQCMAHFMSFDIYEEKPDYTYTYGRNAILQSAASGTGIYSGSDKKAEAMELLSLVMTDTELADALTYGREGESYYREGRGIYRMNGEETEGDIAIDTLNCYAVTSGRAKNPDFDGSRFEYMKAGWDVYSDNPLCGIGFNPEACREERTKIRGIIHDYFIQNDKLLEAEDFEVEWEKFITSLDEAGIDKISQEINKRIEEMLGENE